MLLIKEEEK